LAEEAVGQHHRRDRQRDHSRGFCWIFAGLSIVLLLPAALSWIFLYQAGELADSRSVAKWLQRTNGLYGTALNNNAREIALSIYLERKPDIIVLSSSRGTEFKQQFFTSKFSCVCMMMSSIEEGVGFFEKVQGTHLPKVAILALDYWWFSETDDHVTQPAPSLQPANPVSREELLKPYEWIGQGKIGISDFAAVAAGFRNRSPLSTEPKLGIQAIVKSFGTRADGSWSVMSVAANMDLHPLFATIKVQMKHPELILSEKTGRYAPDQKLSEQKLSILKDLIDRFESRGTNTVLLLLPIANPIVDEMERTGRYTFVSTLRERFGRLKVEYHDFFDSRRFTSVCEFQDQHHGGNAMYARMLQMILDQDKDTILKDHVDYGTVASIAKRWEGHVVAPLGEETPLFREVDFLELGCKK
jgi:hypothetical protein